MQQSQHNQLEKNWNRRINDAAHLEELLRSASSQMINGDFPPTITRQVSNETGEEDFIPSSSETRFKFDLAAAS
jgi:hypothetical protein